MPSDKTPVYVAFGGPVYLQQIKLILTGYTCTFITYVKALKYSAYGYIIFYGNHFRRG